MSAGPKYLGIAKASRAVLLTCLVAWSFSGSARANTYLFSFTTSQLMTALQTAEGPATYNESAYYAIFVQPDPGALSGYSYSKWTSPNEAGPNAWTAEIINDPSSPGLGYGPGLDACTADCQWVGYHKGATQTNVTVISGANGGPGGSNIFIGHSWSSFSTPPFGWGTTSGTIQSVMPGADTFNFIVRVAGTIAEGNYLLQGYAERIQSGDPGSMTADTKESHDLYFTMNATVTMTPEPGTVALFVSGGALLFGLRYRRALRARSR